MRTFWRGGTVWITVATVVLSFGLGAAPASAQFNRPVEAMLSAAVEGYIRPGYAALADASNALQTATVRYCANPSDTTRAAVDESFGRTVQALGAVAFLDFGPASINQRLERLKTPAPAAPEDGAAPPELVPGEEGNGPQDVGALSQEPPELQGLPAFERLLVADPAETGSDQFNETCRVAGLIAANVKSIATALDSEWTKDGGYGDWLTSPAADNPAYARSEDALLEVLSAFSRGVDKVHARLGRIGLSDEDTDADRQIGPFGQVDFVFLLDQAQVRGLGQFYQATDLAGATEPPLNERAAWIEAKMTEAAEGLAAIPADTVDQPDDETIEQIAAARSALAEVSEAMRGLTADLELGPAN